MKQTEAVKEIVDLMDAITQRLLRLEDAQDKSVQELRSGLRKLNERVNRIVSQVDPGGAD